MNGILFSMTPNLVCERTVRPRFALLVASALLTFSSSAFAQDTSRVEVSGGGRYYHVALNSIVDPILLETPNDFPEGWYADIAVNLSEKFTIVGEAGGSYHRDEFTRPGTFITTTESVEIRFHTFMGGVRVRAPQIEWFVPFGQVVFGGERDTSTYERTTTFQSGAPSRSLQETDTSNPVLALDSGVSIMAGPIGVRVSAGYVRIFRHADADALRVNLGAAVRF
jgi:hypothetical protein